MELTSSTYSLSTLTPIKFTYKFNKEEKLTNDFVVYNNGCSYYTHRALLCAQDVVLSKKNLLAITDNISLKDIFHSDSTQIDVGAIAGSLYLKTFTNLYIKSRDKKNVYIGGAGTPLLITVAPIANKTVELFVDRTKRIMIDEAYPYTARISEDILTEETLYRQRFEIDYKNGQACFKVKTKEGHRFLSYGVDKIVRAVGLSLNETVINSYLFKTEFVSSNGMFYDFDAKASEVKYFNELATFVNQQNVNIKDEQESNTHLLISCTTNDIALSGEVPINIALLKSNFSSSGTYSTKQSL